MSLDSGSRAAGSSDTNHIRPSQVPPFSNSFLFTQFTRVVLGVYIKLALGIVSHADPSTPWRMEGATHLEGP